METGKEDVIERKTTKAEWIQIVFLILMLLAVAGLIIVIVQLVKYKQMLANPVGYVLDEFDISYCTCYDTQARLIPIKGLSYNDSFEYLIPKPEYEKKNYTINFNLTDVAE